MLGRGKGRAALALLVVVAAAVGFSIGALPGVAFAGVGSTPAASAPSSAPASVGGPLASVSSPTYSPATATQAAQYGYTITPNPSALDLSQQMTVLVSVGSASGLDSFVNEIQNPTSPLFHDFVTSGAIAGAFGVPASQYTADTAYFTGYGLTVTPDNARMYLTVTGTVQQIEKAFHTQIGAFLEQYRSPGLWNPLYGNASAVLNSTTSRSILLSTGNAYLPSGMHAGSVAGLGTLFAQPEIASPIVGLSPATNLSALGISTTIPTTPSVSSQWYLPPTKVLGGGDESACAEQDYTWAQLMGIDWQFLFPCSMPALTGADNLWNGLSTISSEPDQGQGITIGIIDVGCPIPSDLQAFDQQTGVDVLDHLTVIGLNTPFEYYSNSNLYGCIDNGFAYGWTVETSLDIEYAAAMAPQAHIDLISVGDAGLTSFDSAYQFTAQYLTSGSPATLPSAASVINLQTGATSQSVSGPVTTVTITSNSYGTGEELTAIYGTPQYLQLENEALDELAATGVTNMFASGDSGPTVYPFPVQGSIPALASGVTSVGGGMVTAEYNGLEFPWTWKYTCIGGQWMVVAPVSGIGSYTYWQEGLYIIYQYSFGNVTSPALPPGETGGGFGQSSEQPQPWWQNALDTYSSGALIDPVVSGSAAFNMSVYAGGQWLLSYGGTSFATPIFAGEWALIEEQALTAFGNARFGDINALLFDAHNAQQAGVTTIDPYVPMTNIGSGGITELICSAEACGINIYEQITLWAPANVYGEYQLASQDEFPQDQNLPYWFGTLNNPAGAGWNYLQGLGLPLAAELDNVLIGQVTSSQHALDNEPFYIEEVGTGGVLLPVQSLLAGSTYTFEIVGGTAPFDLTTYSAGSTVMTQISGPTFTYTPAWVPQSAFTNGSEYGYFYVTETSGSISAGWSFQYFAIEQPELKSGTLTLGVETPLGLITNGEAEVPMMASTGMGTVLTGGQALVTLNNVPVGGAVVTQTTVLVPPGAIVDPSLPPETSGSVVGSYLSTVSGLVGFWTDSGQLFADVVDQAPGAIGPIQPVTFVLQASYDGLLSNPIIVTAEPMSGYFSTNLTLSDGMVTGTVGFYGMNYLDYLNVSTGSAPGEYLNTTYVPGTTYTGQFSVDLSAPDTSPVVVSLQAAGNATFMYVTCGGLVGYGDYFMICGLEEALNYGMVWQGQEIFLTGGVGASQPASLVTGTDTFTFSGSDFAGATGTLALVSGADATVLATGLSGSYSLNTVNLPDGAYTVVYTVSAPGAVTSTQSVSFYADNQAAAANTLIAQLESQLATDASTISGLQATITSLQGEVASLQASLTAANASIASLESQVASLNAQVHSLTSQVSTLQGQLATAQATATSLEAQIAALQSDNSANATLVASLQAQLATADSTISTDTAQLSSDTSQIASLAAEVQSLQNELNAKKNYVAPAWYDMFGTLGIALLVAFAALVVGVVAYLGGRRAGRNTSTLAPPEGARASGPGPGPMAMAGATGGSRTPESVITKAMTAVSVLKTEGNFDEANRLTELARTLAREVQMDPGHFDFETMYR